MIHALLHGLLEKHKPEPNIIEQAEESQKRLREILISKLEEDDSLPFVLEGEDFLFGSAVRGTKPAPFNDVDLLLVLDGSTLQALEAGQFMGWAYGSGKNHNPLVLPKYLDNNNLVSSQKVLNHIRETLSKTYSRSEIRKDGQAVNIWMDSYGFGIDVVPAIKINHIKHGPHYFIPQGTNSDMWMSANPWKDLVAFDAEDKRLGGILTLTCRVMRKWNELSNSDRLSGFHIDTLVFRSLVGKSFTTLDSTTRECFKCFSNLLTQPCPQFSGFSPNVDHKLTNENRRLSLQKVQEASRNLNPVLPLSVTNLLRTWNNVFNGELSK